MPDYVLMIKIAQHFYDVNIMIVDVLVDLLYVSDIHIFIVGLSKIIEKLDCTSFFVLYNLINIETGCGMIVH